MCEEFEKRKKLTAEITNEATTCMHKHSTDMTRKDTYAHTMDYIVVFRGKCAFTVVSRTVHS